MIIVSSDPKKEVHQFEDIQVRLTPYNDLGIEVRLVSSDNGETTVLWIKSGGAIAVIHPMQLNAMIGLLESARQILIDPLWWQRHTGQHHKINLDENDW